jgi:gamma-glutamyltranspeptidase/glutathione hydrolase/leukotriene-C4 hydrolase
MLNNLDWRAIFAPQGALLREGEFIQRTKLANTLEIIAKEGADAVYKVRWLWSRFYSFIHQLRQGPIGDALVRKVKATGGILTKEDLAGYKVNVTRALEGNYRGKTIYTPHAPSSGAGQ